MVQSHRKHQHRVQRSVNPFRHHKVALFVFISSIPLLFLTAGACDDPDQVGRRYQVRVLTRGEGASCLLLKKGSGRGGPGLEEPTEPPPTAPQAAAPHHRLKRRDRSFFKRWDPGPLGGWEKKSPPHPAPQGSPASSVARCSRKRRRPQRAAPWGSRPPAPTPPPGPPPGQRGQGRRRRPPAPSPPLAPSLRPRTAARPRALSQRVSEEGPARQAPLMTRSVVERRKFPPDMVPSASARRQEPTGVRLRLRPGVSAPGAGQPAAPRPRFFWAAQAPEGSGRCKSASHPADRTPAHWPLLPEELAESRAQATTV